VILLDREENLPCPFDKGGMGGLLGIMAFWFRLGRVRE
jgi:hypothetical protein